jgi:hypothetical protein
VRGRRARLGGGQCRSGPARAQAVRDSGRPPGRIRTRPSGDPGLARHLGGPRHVRRRLRRPGERDPGRGVRSVRLDDRVLRPRPCLPHRLVRRSRGPARLVLRAHTGAAAAGTPPAPGHPHGPRGLEAHPRVQHGRLAGGRVSAASGRGQRAPAPSPAHRALHPGRGTYRPDARPGHLAGVQRVGRVQPVRRPVGRLRHPVPGRQFRPALRLRGQRQVPDVRAGAGGSGRTARHTAGVHHGHGRASRSAGPARRDRRALPGP